MNRIPLARRLLVGAASLVIGTAGALAAGGPAWATQDNDQTPPIVAVHEVGDCEVTITVTVDTEHSEPEHQNSYELSVRVDGEDGTDDTVSALTIDDGPWAGQPFGQVYQQHPLVQGDSEISVQLEAGTGVHEVAYRMWRGAENDYYLDWVPVEVDCGQDQMPPELAADFFSVVSCDVLVFFVNNRGEEGGITMAFTPNQDAVHGHAPDFLPFLNEFLEAEPGTIIEVPDEAGLVTDGDNVGPIGAGETTMAIGPFNPGDAHAHGFEAAEGLVVTVDLRIGGTPVELEGGNEFAWDELIGDLDCQPDDEEEGDDGQGGELPTTGSATTLMVGGAVALLVLGGGLHLLARRRRVTFTA